MTGAGTFLKRSLAKWGIKGGAGCKCKQYAAEMDAKGNGWCEDNIGTIASRLKEAARGRKLPFSAMVAKRFIKKAIARSRKSMDLKEVFERVYCVSLARRPDRWEQFINGLPKPWPLAEILRFDAIDGRNCKHPDWWTQGGGAWGCYKSHLAIIESCLNEGVNSVLLLEDDAKFSPDFAAKASQFLADLPSDWGMLYLGGQHLFAAKHPPKRISEWVYQPYNVNRTHAWAIRGNMMQVVYKHLHKHDWRRGHHIDHHLGRIHMRRRHKIFCPKEWIVGQSAGQSNVSGRKPGERFWADAEVVSDVSHTRMPFIAIIGNHSSGSSATAGVVHHLGAHLGNKLTGYYGNKPNKSCGFEAVGLVKVVSDAVRFPGTSLTQNPKVIWTQLLHWVNARRREAKKRGTVAGGKHPLLCGIWKQLVGVCQDNLFVVHIDRPLEQSIESMVRRTKGRYRGSVLQDHMKWIDEQKQLLLAEVPSERRIDVDYDELIKDTAATVHRIADFVQEIGVGVTDASIARAIAYVDPEKQHVGSG